tara:strand:- start:1337 stop:2314 length:978 start_codon:yes stop_codon:yes gene_type:complete
MSKRLKDQLSKNINNIKKARILCMGDLLIDHYIYGKVDRFSPEAPIPILLPKLEKFNIGGVGNVAKNILNIGAHVTMIAIYGKLQKEIKKVKWPSQKNNKFKKILISSPNYRLPIKSRYMNLSKHILRVDDELKNYRLKRSIENYILKITKKEIVQCDIVLLSDYEKGFFSSYLIKNIVDIAKSNSKLVIVDPKNTDFTIYSGADIITPNLKELSSVFGKKYLNSQNIIKNAKIIIQKMDISEVLVTRSEKGMTYVNNKKSKNYKAKTKNAIDVTGAGDTVIAILALMKAIGFSTEDSIYISNHAASIVVKKTEAVSLSLKELLS